MNKIFIGVAAALCFSGSVHAESDQDYVLTVTLDADASSQLVASLGSKEGKTVLAEVPVKVMFPYDYEQTVYGEKLVSAKCQEVGGSLNVEPTAEPMHAILSIDGGWAMDPVAGANSPALMSGEFTLKLKDIASVETLGKLNEHCEAQSVTNRGVEVSAKFALSAGEQTSAHYQLGNGYSLTFDLKEQ